MCGWQRAIKWTRVEPCNGIFCRCRDCNRATMLHSPENADSSVRPLDHAQATNGINPGQKAIVPWYYLLFSCPYLLASPWIATIDRRLGRIRVCRTEPFQMTRTPLFKVAIPPSTVKSRRREDFCWATSEVRKYPYMWFVYVVRNQASLSSV
jgi:hypothetical protein